MLFKRCCIFFLSLILAGTAHAQSMKLGLLVYSGGGDWYANPSALKNLAEFTNSQLRTRFTAGEGQISSASPEIFNYPFVHMTGHGRWDPTPEEAQNLRLYLEGGGFLHVDDNYGLDPYVRPALKKIFPELALVELPFSHAIYHQKFNFPNGLPKIHEHESKPPKGYGLLWKGRLVCFYSSECDLGDGWEDADVHKDAPERRTAALQMGANLIQYVFMGAAK